MISQTTLRRLKAGDEDSEEVFCLFAVNVLSLFVQPNRKRQKQHEKTMSCSICSHPGLPTSYFLKLAYHFFHVNVFFSKKFDYTVYTENETSTKYITEISFLVVTIKINPSYKLKIHLLSTATLN